MEPQFIDVNTFAAKYRSKREVYTFLTIDGNAYLSAFDTLTVYFLKDLVAGNKKCKCALNGNMPVVNAERVRYVNVPQYEGLEHLTICNFLDQASPEMARYMPDEHCEIKKLPRGWVINVGASVVGKPFLDWIKQKIQERNDKQARERNLLIKMDPQLAAAFNNSTHHSSKYAYV